MEDILTVPFMALQPEPKYILRAQMMCCMEFTENISCQLPQHNTDIVFLKSKPLATQQQRKSALLDFGQQPTKKPVAQI